MNIEQERERFEDAALAHFISQRAAGSWCIAIFFADCFACEIV